MPSLLSKYRNKKRESTADESSSSHRKGASDSSYDSSAPSPSTVNSARGLNSPFMGEEKRASPTKNQKPKTQQQLHQLHQELPNVPTRSPRTPTNPSSGSSGQSSGQGARQTPQGFPQGNPQGFAQGHPQSHPQDPSQGASQGYPGHVAQGSGQNPSTQQPKIQDASPSQKQQKDVPSTPSHAMPVKGDRIERGSPKQDRQDPWAEWQIRRACPSARFGHSANNVAARDGELLIMGGIRDMDILDDLWIIDTNSLSGYQVKTEGPYVGPRVGHAALTLGNAYIMLGGDTKIKETDPLDDNLYLLNTSTFKWTVAEPVGPRPCGRYGHSICNLGVRIYVFGGQVDDLFFDDMWMFDLNNLRPPNARWEKIEPATAPPPPRTNHTVVTYEDKMYLFGGANGDLWYSDTWCFDSKTNAWTQLECTGYVPAPCQGHAATIVGDVMYVFGGMSSQGLLIGQLFALKLTTRKWYTFQNLGAGPSPRSGHSLTAFDGDKILVWGGTDQSNTAFVLDVSRISYPPDDEAIVDTSYDSREISAEEALEAQASAQTQPSASAAPVVADSTERQVDTHERSTPAARNSVIYSRTSWSPHRRSRMSQQYESVDSLQHHDNVADIPQDVKEAENESSYVQNNSYDFDRSEDFNKSLENNRIARDRPDMGPSVLNQSSDQPLDLPNKNLPEGLPNKVPDTPPLKGNVPETNKSGASPGGIAGAVAGAAGAIGAIGAGIFGKKAVDAHNEQKNTVNNNPSLQSVTDDMPGSWTQTRAETESWTKTRTEYDSDSSSEPQIPGVNADAKSVTSGTSSGSANHTTQNTLDRLNGYDNSYDQALQQNNYNQSVNYDSQGDSYFNKELKAPNSGFNERGQTPASVASSEYPEPQPQSQARQPASIDVPVAGAAGSLPDSGTTYSPTTSRELEAGNPPYPVSESSATHLLNEVSSNSSKSELRNGAPPFEVQTATGTFHSPERNDNRDVPSDHSFSTGHGVAAAGLAGAAGVAGVAAAKLHKSRDIDSSIGGELDSHAADLSGHSANYGSASGPGPIAGSANGQPTGFGTTSADSGPVDYNYDSTGYSTGYSAGAPKEIDTSATHQNPTSSSANSSYDASPSSAVPPKMRGGVHTGSTASSRVPSNAQSAASSYIPQESQQQHSQSHNAPTSSSYAGQEPSTRGIDATSTSTPVVGGQDHSFSSTSSVSVSQGTAVDQATLKRLERDFADVKETMQQQARDASQRIRQLENERDEALRKLSSSPGGGAGVGTGAIAGAAVGATAGVGAASLDKGIDDYRQKHAAVQRDLLSSQEQHQSLMHEHSKLQAQHADLSESSEYLKNTMDQHVRALDAVNKALEQTRITAQTAQQEADALRKENLELKQQNSELQRQVEESSHHSKRSAELESQLNTMRDAHETSGVALNQHLTQLVGHWDQYHQNYQSSRSATSRDLPDDAQHYTSLYEKQKSAHEATQKDLESAYSELAQLKQSQPNIDEIRLQHQQELEGLRRDHDEKLKKLTGDHETNIEDLHTQYRGKSSNLEKQYSDLERDYNDSLEHFKSQRLALERTREELNRCKEMNNKLEEELQDTKLQIQDPDASTASTTSNRHAEVMVRGLKAKIIVLEEERDELRQKVSQLKEAALAGNF